MRSMRSQPLILSLGLTLSLSVGCTVPFLVNSNNNTGNSPGGVITNPEAVNSSLPIFLPQPGQSGANPLPSDGGFGPVASGNPPIAGPLPNPTGSPFIPNIRPNIDNQIIPNAIPTIAPGQTGGGVVIGPDGLPVTQIPIVKSIIKGRVMGFNPQTESYVLLSNAKVRIDESLTLTTDSNGMYETSQEFDKAISISAAHKDYIASTVGNVPPGVGRDIRLSPLRTGSLFRQDVFDFSGSVSNLNGDGKDSTVVFADRYGSQAAATSPNRFTGQYNMQVRLKSNRSSTEGTLFAGVYEEVGKLYQVTQYGYSPGVVVPTPVPLPVPTATPSTSTSDDQAVPLKPTQLLLSFDHLRNPADFGQITVSLSAKAGTVLKGSVVHVYMNLPAGGRVLVAKYNDNTSTSVNQAIRVPKVGNATFTLEARSGSPERGSDIIIPNVQIGNTVVRTFLEPPVFSRLGDETDFSNTNKMVVSSSDTSPQISWQRLTDANSYQLDIQGDTPEQFRWEAYTTGTSLTYPDFGTDNESSLDLGRSYRVQLMASDFDIGTFNVLSEAANGFSVSLYNPGIRNFAQGYRVSYSTVNLLTD